MQEGKRVGGLGEPLLLLIPVVITVTAAASASLCRNRRRRLLFLRQHLQERHKATHYTLSLHQCQPLAAARHALLDTLREPLQCKARVHVCIFPLGALCLCFVYVLESVS